MKPTIPASCDAAPMQSARADSGANCTPVPDGAPSAAFQGDLAACRSQARDQRRFDRETAGAAVPGARAGALAGGVAGAVNARERRKAIVLECLRGRGRRVVG